MVILRMAVAPARRAMLGGDFYQALRQTQFMHGGPWVLLTRRRAAEFHLHRFMIEAAPRMQAGLIIALEVR